MNKQVECTYKRWLSEKLEDKALIEELNGISGDEEAVNDRFYKDLEFGTGGLRGIIGAGTNRMNIYTVAKATRGFANYLVSTTKEPKIAIGYDSRINSDLFSRVAAEVMADAGVKVYIWNELMPTPALSFAVRELKCDGGIMITASHNPSKYNGYKAYGPDGGQLANEAADTIYKSICEVDIFDDFKLMPFEEGLKNGMINIVADELFEKFIANVSTQALAGDEIDRNVKIAYTPLYGTGLKCVTTCLARNGFSNVEIVKEQAHPDGNFPTCPYPNPEFREALELGLKFAQEVNADLLLATDPDCDRVGIAVRGKDNEYKLVSGNEVGVLLLDYICKQRIAHNKMPKNPIAVKTIVSTDLTMQVAKEYGVEIVDVLTGFKYIGEQIAKLEEKNEGDRYILGFEESYGYLSGGYVRDKDAVNASLLIAEMFAYYKTQNISLLDVLEGLYKKYGYQLNTTFNFAFEGESGMKKMVDIMEGIRSNTPEVFAGLKVVGVNDYKLSEAYDKISGKKTEIDLPKSNVIKLIMENNVSVIFRPSGTEPKLKAYVSVLSKSAEEGNKTVDNIKSEIDKIVK